MKNVTYINAGAGSGKTYTLTQKLTNLIRTKCVKPDQVIMTTFTTKAANEIKEKAQAALYKEGLFEEASQLNQAMIGTVHSVCQRMIGKYWFHLGLAPNMGVMADEDTNFYISQSLAELPTEEELNYLHDFAQNFGIKQIKSNAIFYNFWQEDLKKIITLTTNYELNDYQLSIDKSLEYIRQFIKGNSTFTVSDNELSQMLKEANEYVVNSKRIKNKENYLDSFEKIRKDSYKKTLAWYKLLAEKLEAKYGPTCQEIQERLTNLYSTKEIYDEQEKYILLIFNLAKRWKENFSQFKREKCLIDYNDMEKYMWQLMQNKDIATEISQSYRYLFVDEFQDSSPIQVKIFDALSDLMEHSYWVGDYKQAIYGFRGSDIALTKSVVDRINQKKDGCDTMTLDTSFRSLPEIVEVNNAIFTKTFSGVLDNKKNIQLKQHRINEDKEPSLRYYLKEETNAEDIVAKLISDGVNPKDIAVIARNNMDLSKTAEILANWYNISSNRDEIGITGSKVMILMEALLRIIQSDKDNLSKAIIAQMTEYNFTTKDLIEKKIEHDSQPNSEENKFLSEIPLIKQLLSIREKLQQQSIATMVESLTIELNLFKVVKMIEYDTQYGNSFLHTILNAAKVYEQHCVQMNFPTTIEGFISYLNETELKAGGNPDGVQLYTYHKCKGLQWKYVILLSLNHNESDSKRIMRNEIYGVHFEYKNTPSIENPYPEIYIRLTPWIFGAYNSSIAPEISSIIEKSDEYKFAYDSALAESNRILYVGMTRPRDVLILEVTDKNPLLWFKTIGITEAGTTAPQNNWDALGVKKLFSDCTLNEDEIVALKSSVERESIEMQLTIDEPKFESRPPRYLSPSEMNQRGKVIAHHNFGIRIPLSKQVTDMTIVGNCIHQLFAGIETEKTGRAISFEETVKSYQLEQILTDSSSILNAWTQLKEWLTQNFGKAIKTYHERPFRMEKEGHTIVGSIDFVWKTKEGSILIDFKTNPMGEKELLNENSDFYSGKYAGQLNAYTEALECAGEKVLKRFVYYPICGLIAEI